MRCQPSLSPPSALPLLSLWLGLRCWCRPASAGHSPVGVAGLSQTGPDAPLLSLCNWLGLSSLSSLSALLPELCCSQTQTQHHSEAALQSQSAGESDHQSPAVSSELSVTQTSNNSAQSIISQLILNCPVTGEMSDSLHCIVISQHLI